MSLTAMQDIRKKKRIWIAMSLIVLFMILIPFVRNDWFSPVEDFVYDLLIQRYSPAMTTTAKLVSWTCNPLFLAPLCLLLFLIPQSRRTIALPFSLTIVFAAVVNVLLKKIFARERPTILQLVEETSFSFPSGHAMASAAIGCILFFQILLYIHRKKRKIFFSIAVVLFPFGVGLSRIYLGVHYAGDVLGGWMLGIAIGIFVSLFWEIKHPHLGRKVPTVDTIESQ